MRSKRSTPVRCLRGQPDAPRERGRPARILSPPPLSTLPAGAASVRAEGELKRRFGSIGPGNGAGLRPDRGGRDARAPGGHPPITLAPQGRASGLAGPQPCRCGRAVTLGGPSSFFVSLRGQLFFRLFQASAGPPTAPRHFNPSSRAALFQKMSSTWVSLRRSDQQAHLSERRCSRPVSTGLSC